MILTAKSHEIPRYFERQYHAFCDERHMLLISNIFAII